MEYWLAYKRINLLLLGKKTGLLKKSAIVYYVIINMKNVVNFYVEECHKSRSRIRPLESIYVSVKLSKSTLAFGETIVSQSAKFVWFTYQFCFVKSFGRHDTSWKKESKKTFSSNLRCTG